MALLKSILCSGICILYFTALTAQLPLQKNNNINNVIDQHVYQQKSWIIKQVLKDSVLYKYESYCNNSILTISSLSMIYISLTEQPLVSHLSVSEKLESHVQKSLLEHYKYLLVSTSCWNQNFFNRYKASVTNKPFFKYQ